MSECKCGRPKAIDRDFWTTPEPAKRNDLCWSDFHGPCYTPEESKPSLLSETQALVESERKNARLLQQELDDVARVLHGDRSGPMRGRAIDALWTVAGLTKERDDARALLESAKERALSAEREVNDMMRVLNGYRSFPLTGAAMHCKQTLEQLEAKITRLTLEVVQHESQLEEARASTESLTAEFQRAVADCDDARAALSALDADGFAKFAAETARASQLEAEVARLRAELKRSQDYGAGPTWSTHREALVAVAEKQREASLRRVFFKLKAALGAGAHQKALEEVIDAERAAPLVTEGKP